MAPENSSHTTITVRPRTLREVRSLKRGGESYDSLMRKMAAQYDPEGARS